MSGGDKCWEENEPSERKGLDWAGELFLDTNVQRKTLSLDGIFKERTTQTYGQGSTIKKVNIKFKDPEMK